MSTTTSTIPPPAATTVPAAGSIGKSTADKLKGSWKEGKPQKTQYRGKEYNEVKYTKADESFGKIPTAIAYGFLGVMGTALSLFTANASESFRKFTWGNVVKTVKSDEPLIGAKTARAAASALLVASVVGIPALIASEDLRDATINRVIDKAERKVYFETGAAEKSAQEFIDELGYNPKDPVSVGTFLKSVIDKDKKDPNIREIDGYIVYREHRRPGVSACLIIPSKDFETSNFKAAESRVFWYAKDGSPVKDDADQWRAIRSYLVCKDDIDKEWGKQAEIMAKAKLKRANEDINFEDPAVVKELRKETEHIKEHGCKSVVISARNHHARIYGTIDPNTTNVDSFRTGTLITFSSDTKKRLDAIYDKNLMEHKAALSGQQPYRKTPEPTTGERDLDAIPDPAATTP